MESENHRVKVAMNSNCEALGKLLNQTHDSLKTIGVSTPDVDALVKSLQSSDGVHGARMMVADLVV